MNILFFSTVHIDIEDRSSLYGGLLRFFIEKGHKVCAVSPIERKNGQRTYLRQGESYEHLFVRSLNIFETSKVEKGLSYIALEYLFRRVIAKYWRERHFDLILYPTPPPIFSHLIGWCKKRYSGSISYMMLKDIFPQNAVDLGMMSPGGVTHRFFKKLELATMHASDYIGCMSPANVEYVRAHYPSLPPSRIEICPNTSFPTTLQESHDSQEIRCQLGLPIDTVLFVYGGNLGKPQGIPHLLDCIRACQGKEAHFVIIGKGTEYGLVDHYILEHNLSNATLMPHLPVEKYNHLLSACDVGLISLDGRFTFPNFPSRLLGYQGIGLPILAVTDHVSDVGQIIEQNGFGKWCPADSIDAFSMAVDLFIANKDQLPKWGASGHRYMLDYYTHEVAYNTIMSHFTAL